MTPRTRAECPSERPCPNAAGCRYGLAAGRCALDVADDGAHELVAVAELLGVSLGRARQVEAGALAKVGARLAELGLEVADVRTERRQAARDALRGALRGAK